MSQKSGCLGMLFSLFRSQPEPPEVLPYQKVDSLLTITEQKFYTTLLEALGANYAICAKVRMIDLVEVKPNTENWRSYQNKVIQKHVDFVLCRRETLEPVIAIELDDSSHNRSDRQQRDITVDDIFASANMPLLHYKTAKNYSAEDIRTRIKEALNLLG